MQPKRKTKMRIVEVFFIYLIFLVKLNECIYIYIGKKEKKRDIGGQVGNQMSNVAPIFGHVQCLCPLEN
jgi:hypothetical protein